MFPKMNEYTSARAAVNAVGLEPFFEAGDNLIPQALMMELLASVPSTSEATEEFFTKVIQVMTQMVRQGKEELERLNQGEENIPRNCSLVKTNFRDADFMTGTIFAQMCFEIPRFVLDFPNNIWFYYRRFVYRCFRYACSIELYAYDGQNTCTIGRLMARDITNENFSPEDGALAAAMARYVITEVKTVHRSTECYTNSFWDLYRMFRPSLSIIVALWKLGAAATENPGQNHLWNQLLSVCLQPFYDWMSMHREIVGGIEKYKLITELIYFTFYVLSLKFDDSNPKWFRNEETVRNFWNEATYYRQSSVVCEFVSSNIETSAENEIVELISDDEVSTVETQTEVDNIVIVDAETNMNVLLDAVDHVNLNEGIRESQNFALSNLIYSNPPAVQNVVDDDFSGLNILAGASTLLQSMENLNSEVLHDLGAMSPSFPGDFEIVEPIPIPISPLSESTDRPDQSRAMMVSTGVQSDHLYAEPVGQVVHHVYDSDDSIPELVCTMDGAYVESFEDSDHVLIRNKQPKVPQPQQPHPGCSATSAQSTSSSAPSAPSAPPAPSSSSKRKRSIPRRVEKANKKM